MVYPEIYTGAQYTIRYNVCQEEITDFYEDSHGVTHPFGFGAVLAKMDDDGLLTSATNPKFYALEADLVTRLELKDGMKELSAETPEGWAYLATRRFMEIASKYESVLTMEQSTGFDVTNPNKESRTIEYGHVIDGQVQDTPYGELNANSDYVSGRTSEQHSGEDVIHERNELDAEILADFRRKWESTMNVLVDEFDVLFIRITGDNFVIWGDNQ